MTIRVDGLKLIDKVLANAGGFSYNIAIMKIWLLGENRVTENLASIRTTQRLLQSIFQLH